MFVCIICLWAIETLGPVATGSVMCGLRLGQSWIGHYHHPCATHTPVHPKDRTDNRLKVVCPCSCPNPSTGSFPWSLERPSTGCLSPIVKSINWGHPFRFLGVSLHKFSTWSWNVTILLAFPSVLIPYYQLNPNVPIPTASSPPTKISSITPIQGDLSTPWNLLVN